MASSRSHAWCLLLTQFISQKQLLEKSQKTQHSTPWLTHSCTTSFFFLSFFFFFFFKEKKAIWRVLFHHLVKVTGILIFSVQIPWKFCKEWRETGLGWFGQPKREIYVQALEPPKRVMLYIILLSSFYPLKIDVALKITIRSKSKSDISKIQWWF